MKALSLKSTLVIALTTLSLTQAFARPRPPAGPAPKHDPNGRCKRGDFLWSNGECHSYAEPRRPEPKPVVIVKPKPAPVVVITPPAPRPLPLPAPAPGPIMMNGHRAALVYSSEFRYYYQGHYYATTWWVAPRPVVVAPRPAPVVVARMTCSPAKVQSNLASAEAVLQGLAQNELSDSPEFQRAFAAFANESDARVKIEMGYRFAGIQDPSKTSELAKALYVRENSAEMDALARTVSGNFGNMSAKKSKLLITTVTQALRDR